MIKRDQYQYNRRFDQVYEKLRDEILRGHIRSGLHFVELELSKKFGVSTGTIRSALMKLEKEGLVVSHPRSGFSTRVWTYEEIEGVFVVRSAMECESARLASGRMTETQVELFNKIIMKMDIAEKNKDFAEAYWLNFQLHLMIARVSQCDFLINELERINMIAFAMFSNAQFPRIALTKSRSISDHDELLKAIISGNQINAIEKMHDHIMQGLVRIQYALENEKYTLPDKEIDFKTVK